MNNLKYLTLIGLLCVNGKVIAYDNSAKISEFTNDITNTTNIYKDSLTDSVQILHELQEVIVNSNFSTHKDGVVTYNVATLPNIDKIQVDKLLTLIPGISKAGDGSYEYLGKPIAFYLNGVKQNLDAKALTALFASLPASVISNVKVVEVNNGKLLEALLLMS